MILKKCGELESSYEIALKHKLEDTARTIAQTGGIKDRA
jgi:hypothetical protein